MLTQTILKGETMISNETAIERLHKMSTTIRTTSSHKMVYEIDIADAYALDLGASAIKTIEDMSDTFQKLITLTPSDIDTLTSFLKTHSVSEIVATLDYLNAKCHLNNLYGKMVYTDTDSIKLDVSRETSESVNE